MSVQYTLTYDVPPEMLKRAMTSWARPHDGRKKRLVQVVIFLVGCVGLGLAIGMSGFFDQLSGDFLTGGLIGLYAGVAISLAVRFLGMRKVARLSLDQLEKQGETTSTLSADEVRMANDLGWSVLLWRGFDQVILMADATALRKGGMIFPIPHNALPSDVTAEQFHADLVAWQEAAQ